MKATLTTHRAGVASTGNYTTYTVAEAVELCRRHGLTRVHIQADFNGRVAILQDWLPKGQQYARLVRAGGKYRGNTVGAIHKESDV